MYRNALEEERHRHLQDVCNLLKSTCSHPVSALLVFLYLLKGQTNGIRELLLAHAKHQSAHPNPTANMLIGGVRNLLGHCTTCTVFSYFDFSMPVIISLFHIPRHRSP